MAIFKQEMEKILMNRGALYKLAVFFATRKGGELDLMWQDAKATVDYFYDSNILDTDNLDEARFFVLADSLTYIPYGSSGYSAFASMLKEINPDISAGQYRYQWLEKYMGERLTWLNDGQREYVKYYFENYNKKTINLKIPADVASLICRFHHECEAHFKTEGFINLTQIDEEHMNNFSDRFAEMYEECDSVDADQFLKDVPPYGDLGEKELEYIRIFTGLKEG